MAFATASLGSLSVRGASHAVVRHTTWGEQKTAQPRTGFATRPARQPRLRQLACRAAGGEPRDEAAPPAAPRPGPVDQEEDPPWVRRERERELQAGAPKDLPFGVYLLFSTFVGIAAVRHRCAARLSSSALNAMVCPTTWSLSAGWLLV
jgi:hypothetical protein